MGKARRFGFQEGQRHIVPVHTATVATGIAWATVQRGWKWKAEGWEISRVLTDPVMTEQRTEYELFRVGDGRIVGRCETLAKAKRVAEDLS